MSTRERSRNGSVDQGTASIRIALLDDEPTGRDAVIELLESDPTVEVVGAAASVEEGVSLLADEHPDVVLVEARLDGGEAATREAANISPHTKVVGFSDQCEREAVLRMLRAGAIGFVDKGSTPQQIIEAVHAAAEGRAVVSPQISGDIVVELAGRLRADDLEEREAIAGRERIEEVLESPDAIEVLFQPIVQIGSGTLVGFEALTRFVREPRRPPDEWFREAASVGLEGALEAKSLRRAFARVPDLPGGAYLSVNVSPETLPSVALQAVLEDVPLDRTVIELTEHAVVHDYRTLSDSLGRLRSRGARIAVDDAGAGYASLRHIVKLMPDIIKLDAELTSGIEADSTLHALAAALITFATETEVEIVAEGVETRGEREALLALGVPYAQGFLFGRPAPLPTPRPLPRGTGGEGRTMLTSVVERELRALADGPGRIVAQNGKARA